MTDEWITLRLDDACQVDYGTRVVKKKDGGCIYPVYGGGGATFRMDIFNREDCLVVARFAMSEKCTRFVKGKFFLNDSGLTVKSKHIFLSQSFLDWLLLSKNNLIYSFGKGSAQKNLDMDDFRRMILSFPPSLSEQQRIVDVLEAEFTKIDALKTKTEENLLRAKDLFKSTLKHVFTPKNEWEKHQLGELAQFKNGINFGKETGSHQYRFLGVGDFKDNVVLDAESLGVINKGIIDEDCFLNKDDIVFVRSNGSRSLIGRCLRIINVKGDAVFSGFCIRCRINDKRILPQYLVYYCSMDNIRSYLTSSGGGCNISNLNQKVLSSLTVSIPPTIEEQESIVSTIEELKRKCQELQTKYEKTIALCDDLKQSLLRKAFKGELMG